MSESRPQTMTETLDDMAQVLSRLLDTLPDPAAWNRYQLRVAVQLGQALQSAATLTRLLFELERPGVLVSADETGALAVYGSALLYLDPTGQPVAIYDFDTIDPKQWQNWEQIQAAAKLPRPAEPFTFDRKLGSYGAQYTDANGRPWVLRLPACFETDQWAELAQHSRLGPWLPPAAVKP